MNNFGKFIRKLSTDTENESAQSGNLIGGNTGKTGLMSGPSKLFDSVTSKRNDFVSGLSSTFEQIKRRTSIETLSFTDKEGIKEEDENANLMENDVKPNTNDTISSNNSISTVGNSVSGSVVNSDPYNDTNRLMYTDARNYIEQTTSEELRNYEKEKSESVAIEAAVQNPASRKLPPPKPPPPLKKQQSAGQYEDEKSGSQERFSRSQTLADRDIMEDMRHNESLKKESGILATEVLQDARIQLEQLTQLECQKIVSAMGEMIGVSGEKENMLCVDHTGNSSPSEYGGDKGDHPDYGEEGTVGNGSSKERSHDLVRKMSQVSIEESDSAEEMTEEYKMFLDNLINMTFNEESENPLDKSLDRFHRIVQIRASRAWVARLIEQKMYANNTKHVSETVFFRLLHIMTLVLLECLDNDDFLPARDLMLLAYGCNTNINCGSQKSSVHHFYLSSCICSHPIWKSVQFWSFCFFNAVQDVRSKKATIRRNSANTTDADGVAFHQLQVHLNYMRSLGLPVNLCSEFVRKQVNIVNLTDDEMTRLKEVMESWKE